MGNRYEGEKKGIVAMNGIPEAARKYINHHLGNSLTSLNNCLAIGEIEGSIEVVNHIVNDLKRVGFFQLMEKEESQSREDGISKIIWWNINKGDDKRNGLSPEEAVKTQARVSDLLERSIDIKQSKTGCLAIYPGRDIKFEKI